MGARCGCFRPKLPATLEQKYEIDDAENDDILGQGTFAVVYRGRHRKTRQEVAIKIIDKAKSRRDLLNTEIWIVRHFGDHPNIVNLFDIYETDDEVQLVLEVMTGGELFDLLDENGPCNEADASKFLRSIASGLAYLHAGNIAHRDLKPENLLLSQPGPLGVLKISDFGLAKILVDDEVMRVACGTWIYCAPEVLLVKYRKQGYYDLKCDIFSVGCILYIMMGGYHPFDCDGNDDEGFMQECILSDNWGFYDFIWRSVSHDTKDLIDLMLSWDTKDRPTAQELLDHPWTQGKKVLRPPSGSLPLSHFTPDPSLHSVQSETREVMRTSLGHAVSEHSSSTPATPFTYGSTGAAPESPHLSDPSAPYTFELDAGTGSDSAKRLAQRQRRQVSVVSNSCPRHLPKKHVPHAGSRAEDISKTISHMVLKGVGTNFDAEANEARWEKYYLKSLEKRKQDSTNKEVASASQDLKQDEGKSQNDAPPSDAQAGVSGFADRANRKLFALPALNECAVEGSPSSFADSGSPSSVVLSCETPSSMVSGCSTDVGKDASPKKHPGSIERLSSMSGQQFSSVAEWKAKKAPRLLKKDTQKKESAPGTEVKSPRKVKVKSKSKAKAKSRASAAASTASPLAPEPSMDTQQAKQDSGADEDYVFTENSALSTFSSGFDATGPCATQSI